jgi:hypothetical protein
MSGQGIWAELIRKRFARAVRELGLADRAMPLRTDLFHRPARAGDQLSLF